MYNQEEEYSVREKKIRQRGRGIKEMEQIAEMHKIQNRLEKYVQTQFRRHTDTEIR